MSCLEATSHDEGVKVSPLHHAYSEPTPQEYSTLLDLRYEPCINVLPDYCSTLLDCGASFGSTTLSAMYGWDFKMVTKFWEGKTPLTEEDRGATLIDKRVKTIGIDLFPQPLEYGKSMNTFDMTIIQDFKDEPSAAVLDALNKADCLIIQHCISYMPLEMFLLWVKHFCSDRSRPKRLIYDYNPYFDERELSPLALFGNVHINWTFTTNTFEYRDKTSEELERSKDTGTKLFVHHVVIDISAV